MKTGLLKILFVLAVMTVGMSASAQDFIVSGTVYDSQTQEPVPGAAVVVQGTTNGVATGNDGKYTIRTTADAVLVCSCFGYTDATQKVSSKGASYVPPDSISTS